VGKRLSVDEKLAAIRQLRDREPSPEVLAELRRAAGDRSNLVVAAAATTAADRRYSELAPAIEAAFDRFMEEPEKDDKLCRAKLAIVQALDALDREAAGVFERAARHVQMEPVWGGEVDTAAPLRAAAILALARIGHRETMTVLVDALADPEKEVRIAAAQALGQHGSEAACLVLRFKARIGDGDPEVLSECLHGLLAASPRDNLPFVASFLEPTGAGVGTAEAAILALGKSRLPEAIDLLKSAWQRGALAAARDEILLALAMLRLPAATDFLLELVAVEPETTAIRALSALLIHRHDTRLRERLGEAVRKHGGRSLLARFQRDFRSDD
jgi:HEAT repeat protein